MRCRDVCRDGAGSGRPFAADGAPDGLRQWGQVPFAVATGEACVAHAV